MKVGDLVTWYSKPVEGDKPVHDIGLVTKYSETRSEIGASWYIVWNSNDGNGWFYEGHPSIGFIR